MSENHKIIPIFVASPSGLDKERKAIREAIEDINRRHSSNWLLQFKAIGWEETVGGNRRPQEIINQELEKCDYFFGLMADHWGSPPYRSEDFEVEYTSGFQEEYELAQKLYKNNNMKDILLFFKKIPKDKMQDPGPSLSQVLQFQSQVRHNRKSLFAEFDKLDEFKKKIGDALCEIGWKNCETTTPISGGVISAPSSQNTNSFESAIVTHTDTKEYHFSRSTRKFINAIQNKSGKANALTNVEVARLRLISAGTNRAGNDDAYIGVHDANLLFYFRSDLDLSHLEKTTLFTAGLRFMERQYVPFWYWTDGNVERVESLIQIKMIAINDSVASSALKIAEIFGYRPPPPLILKCLEQGNWIKGWFEDERTSGLRNCAETYLSKWAEEDDIPALQEVRERKLGQQAAILDCIIVGIKFRHSESAGFRELNERDPELISAELQTILQDAIQGQTLEMLEGLTKRKADYLRLTSIRELVRRCALSEELAKELSEDSSKEVRLEARKSLSDKGIPIPKERAKQALEFKKNVLGLGTVLSGRRDTVDTSKFEDCLRHKSGKMSLDEFLALEEYDNSLDADAFLEACQKFPKKTENLLRDLIKDGLENHFEKRLAGSLITSSRGAELAKRLRIPEGFTCLGLTQKALVILLTQMKQRDLSLVREVIDRQEIERSKEVFQYFARFGSLEDIERILKLRDGFEKGVTLLTGVNYTGVEDLAQVLVKIGSNQFVDLIERFDSPELLHGVIKAVGSQEFKRLSDEKVLEFMGMGDHNVRKVTALRCIQVLSKSRISCLLEKYMAETERYYNTIYWLDLGSTMPRRYVQEIVRRELEKL